ncbi:G-protein coupled receptor 4-like [Fundulus heteroclitus]|uniref:G-protein coupled receptor 4-like n=1 Tax=Fundulus heteroclitus TaxID=8078 RepID=UPI00165AA29F|nr:G-protein coupled receptor 4-like [Fundulus heteroclitus]
MEELDYNYTSEEYDYGSDENRTGDKNDNFLHIPIVKLVDLITIGVGLPLTFIVIVALFLQVKKNQSLPVYVINLLFSDLIQFCCRITYLVSPEKGSGILFFGLIASVGFMVCISCERYLVVAKPLWYRFRRNIKTYVVVCVVVWVLPVPFLIIFFLPFTHRIFSPILSCALLLPFPFFVFCLVGTIKALSGAISVPADEKRRIAAIQVAVLLIYTLLFLPIIVYLFKDHELILSNIFEVCVFLSPLADTTLYLLCRKSILDKFLASLCSCKASETQEISSKDTESTTAPNTENF